MEFSVFGNSYSFGLDGVVLLFVLFAIAIIFVSLYFFLLFSKMHPKVFFKIYARNGVWTEARRLYGGKIPTKLSIIDIMLGFKAQGFPIKYFRQENFDRKFYYVAQSIEGRLFPLPLSDVVGNTIFYEFVCENSECRTNTTPEGKKYFSPEEKQCPVCFSEISVRSVAVNNLILHTLKFSPDIEKRALWRMDTQVEPAKYIPISEFIQIYDIGAKIAEMMTEEQMETKTLLDQKNPVMTAIISALPMAILLFGFGVAAYLLWQGMGANFNEGAKALQTATENLKLIYNITNSTNITIK